MAKTYEITVYTEHKQVFRVKARNEEQAWNDFGGVKGLLMEEVYGPGRFEDEIQEVED